MEQRIPAETSFKSKKKKKKKIKNINNFLFVSKNLT
jgi:hypothetical protein